MSNELYHYGVPGMKWGVRKSNRKIQRIEKRAKKKGWSDDAVEAKKIKTKKLNQMSNDDLKTLNKRQELEQKHKQFNPNAIKKGLAIAGTTVAAMGTLTALYKYGDKAVRAGKKVAVKIMSNRFR